jgi:hypothetical protein
MPRRLSLSQRLSRHASWLYRSLCGPPLRPDFPTYRRHHSRPILEELERRCLFSVTPVGSEFRINTYTPGPEQTFPQTPRAVSMNATTGDYVVVWSSQNEVSGTGWNVYGQRYDAAGSPQGGEFLVDSPASKVNQQYANVAMAANGNFIVTWSANGNGTTAIDARVFNAAGVAQTSVLVLASTNQPQFSTVATDANGNFVVSWLANVSGQWEIFGQRYSSRGQTQGSTFTVTTSAGGGQAAPSAAMNAAGNFLITWAANSNVYVQEYSAGGTPAGSLIQITAGTTNGQADPTADIDPAGNFVVTWAGQQAGSADVFGQCFTAAGVAQGPVFQVNTDTQDNQQYPTVALSANDNFVVSWSSQNQDGNGWGVFARAFAFGGTALGGALQVNTFTHDDQEFSSIAADTSGRFTVVWSSKSEDGNNFGVYGQQFVDSNIQVSPTTGLQTTRTGGLATFNVVLGQQPTDTVTIPLASSNTNEGTLSTSSLTFTPANWNVPQIVTVTGQNDGRTGNVAYLITGGPAVSNDPAYNGNLTPSVYVTNTAGLPTPGINVSTTVLTTTEAGDSSAFSVSLNSQPLAPVTISLANGNATQGSLSQSSLVFTATNWNLPQTVVVSGLDDLVVNGDVTYLINGIASSTDASYDGLAMAPITVVNQECDVAGINLSTTSLTTSETGASASVSVVLTSEPLATVTLNLSSTNPGQGTLSNNVLHFDPAHWNVPQTITVTGLDDHMTNGDVTYQIVGVASANDVTYNGMNLTPVTVVNTEADVAGFSIDHTSVQTNENGGTATFHVALTVIPTSMVSLTLTMGNTAEGVLSTSTLTFDNSNWNLPQTVTVVGRDDQIVHGDQTYQITGSANSSDTYFKGATTPVVTVVNREVDQAAFTLSATNLTTTESGGKATFNVALTSQPLATVTLNFTNGNASQGSLSTSKLTFTTNNWNTPQSVTITGLDDHLLNGDVTYHITGTATSTDTNYNALTMPQVTVVNKEEDLLGTLISVSPTSVQTNETGGTTSFKVVLTQLPVGQVTVNLVNSNPAEGTLSASSLVFTLANWRTAQTVTITPVDDQMVNGDVLYQITGTASSIDPAFNGMAMNPVTVDAKGEADTAGISVSATTLTTSESGTTATFALALTSEPAAAVTINLNETVVGQGSLSGNSITFNPNNWNVPQTVNVHGLDDHLINGNISYQIIGIASSADPHYDGMQMAPVSVANQEADSAGISVGQTSLQTTESGGIASFTVRLTAEPIVPVTITLTNGNAVQGALSQTSLTFDSTNWNTPQTITVIGLDDHLNNGNVTYQITGKASSSDSHYNGMLMPTVTVVNREADVATYTLSTNALTTSEAGTADMFSLLLTSQPSATVTVTFTSNNAGQGTLSESSVTFTASNWNLPHYVTLTGLDDHLVNGNINYRITGAFTSTDGNYNSQSLAINVVNLENDAAGFAESPTYIITTESGAQATFNIALTSQPTAPVTINFTSTAPIQGTFSGSVIFTTSNWNVPQAVTVTGTPDHLPHDGDQTYQINGIATSTDPHYNRLAMSPITVLNKEADLVAINVSNTSLTTTEGGDTASFSVTLNTIPANTVTVNLVNGNPGQGSLSASSVTFTPSTWNVPQVVTVTGLDDGIANGDQTYQITGTASTPDLDYYGITMPTVIVVNKELHDISGTIYEDVNGNGSVADDGVGRGGVSVLLYRDNGNGKPDASDTLISTTTTGATGSYTFTDLPNAVYWVAVDSKTVTPSAGFNSGFTQSNVWAEQSYGSAGSVALSGGTYAFTASAGAFYGMQPGVSDSASKITTSQDVTHVALTGTGNIGGVDSGFSFNVITTTLDGTSVQGSLRQFLSNANAIAGQNSSQFAIPTSDSNYSSTTGAFTISPGSALPTLTDPIVVDGSTQPGFSGKPLIDLSGLSAGNTANGLVLSAGNSAVENLAINGFKGYGVELTGKGNNLLQGDYIGTDVTGTSALGNGSYGVFVSSSKQNTIGGSTAGSGNVISGNGLGGISISSGNNTSIYGNLIGTDVTGTVALANSGNGITIASGNNLVGDVVPGAANTIEFNSGAGVFVSSGNGNIIRGNSIYGNTALGIDLTPSGVNTNVAGSNQNCPVLQSATASGTSIIVAGQINTQPNANVNLDFYASPTADSSGHGQGQIYVGSTTLLTDVNGNANFNVSLPGTAPAGYYVSATATAGNNDTSEFSANVVMRSSFTVAPTSITTTEAGGAAPFKVALNQKPAATVTITLASSAPGQGALSTSTLTFTTTSWNKAQTVTVTGLDDHIVNGDRAYQISGTASSSDAAYNGLLMPPVTVVNKEVDVAGITADSSDILVAQNNNVVRINTVTGAVLATYPAGPGNDGLAVGPDGTLYADDYNNAKILHYSVGGALLGTFSTVQSNPQGLEFGPDGNLYLTYANATVLKFSPTGTDLGVFITSGSGGLKNPKDVAWGPDGSAYVADYTGDKILRYNGTTGAYINVFATGSGGGFEQLTVGPNGNLYAANYGTGAIYEYRLADGTLLATFVSGLTTPWGIQFNAAGNLEIATQTSGNIQTYNGTTGAFVGNLITGLASPTYIASTPTLITSNAGAADTFTLVLRSEPAANVTVTLTSSVAGQGSLSQSVLTFTPANWNVPQVVTVTGFFNPATTGDQVYQITGTATSSDPTYDGMSISPVITVDNRDVIGRVFVSNTSLQTYETGTSASFNVTLNKQPASTVTIQLVSSAPGQGTLSQTSLTFTTSNWNVAQTVTVTGLDDHLVNGDQTYQVTGVLSSSDSNFNGVAMPAVTVVNKEADLAGFRVAPGLNSTLLVSCDNSVQVVNPATRTLVTSYPTALADDGVAVGPDGSLYEGDYYNNQILHFSATGTLLGSFGSAQLIAPQGLTFGPDGNLYVTCTNGPTNGFVDKFSPSGTFLGMFVPGGSGGLSNAKQIIWGPDGSAYVTSYFNSEVIRYNGTTGAFLNVFATGGGGFEGLAFGPDGNLYVSSYGNNAIYRYNGTTGALMGTFVSGATLNGPYGLVFDSAGNLDVACNSTGKVVSYGGTNGAFLANLVTNLTNPSYLNTTGPLVTSEIGTSASFKIALTSAPVSNVTITFTCSEAGQGSLSSSNITFTRANWNVPQTVTVTGLDDHMVNGNQTYEITGTASSADQVYNGLTTPAVTVINTEADTAGITVAPTSIITSQAGGTGTFSVGLTSMPSAPVTITLTSGDPTQGTLSSTTLVFTPSNWNVAQTVTVTGLNTGSGTDDVYQIYGTASGSDGTYNGMGMTPVTVTNEYVEVAGIRVTQTTLTTSEAGTSTSFGIVLTSAPTANVTITFACTEAGQGSLLPTSVTFTTATWNMVQLVTVTGLDDHLINGDQKYQITGTASSGDGNYNGLTMTPITVTNTEADGAGIQVSPKTLTTSESGTTASFQINLTSQPTAAVTISLTVGDPTQGSLSQSTLTFDASNWNVPQTVMVSGLDDHIVNGDQTYQVTGSATSGDNNYNGLAMTPVTVTNTEADIAGIVVTSGPLTTSESGTTTSFQVSLVSQPTAAVMITLVNGNPGQGTLSQSALTFDGTNWNQPQTVAVTGLDDLIVNGDQTYQIMGSASSRDTSYAGVTMQPVTVTNTEADVAGIAVSGGPLTTSESGTSASFQVSLTSEPTAQVTITLANGNPAQGVLSTSTFTFDATDWNVPQTVTVTGLDDHMVNGDQAYQITGSASSIDTIYDAMPMTPVAVTNTEADTDGIVVSPGSLTTSESGTTDTFQVNLTGPPTAPVTVTLVNGNPGQGSLSASSLTFDSTDWNMPQSVTVTGLDDQVVNGDQTYQIGGTALSEDLVYNGMSITPVTVTNTEADVASIAVTRVSLTTSEAGTTDSFQVSLTSQPSALVTITLRNGNPAQGSLSTATLTFDATNWNVPQAVTVTGVDDHILNGDQSYQITGVVSSADSKYAGMAMTPVAVTNIETDLAGIDVTPGVLTTSESGTAAGFMMRLESKPLAPVTITLTIGNQSQGSLSQTSITFTSADWSVPQHVTVTGLDDGLFNGDQAYELTGVASSADGNYNNLMISPITVVNQEADAPTSTVVSASSNPSVYGDAITFTATASAADSATPTGTVTFFDGTTSLGTVALSSGSAAITVSSLSAGDHSITAEYNGVPLFVTSSSSPLDETVAPATLTVTANNATRVYGQANPAFTDTITGFVNGDTSSVVSGSASLTTSATAFSGVGTYGITAGLGSLSAANYSFAYVDGTLTITPATLVVAADVQSKVYGDANPALTATIAGFVNGDTSAAVGGAASLTTTATASSGVGSYHITAAQGSLSAANYTFTFVDGTLLITPAILTVTDNEVMIYGALLPTLTATFSGFVNADDMSSISGNPELTTAAASGSGVGSYTITVSPDTLSAANYGFACVDGTLTVMPATLTVTATDASKIYGDANPAFTDSVTGLVNGDTLNVLSGVADLNTTATSASEVGTYPISAAQGTLYAANYAFTFANGTLTVSPAMLTVTAVDCSKVEGQANPAFTASFSGLVNGDTADSLSGALTFSTPATTTSPVGMYWVSLSGLSSVDYGITYVDGTLTVIAPTASATGTTVVSSGDPMVYGQVVTFTATVSAIAPATGTPTGRVTFLDGSVVLGTAPLSGGVATIATSALDAGDHLITVSYSGDAVFAPSDSSVLTESVTPAPLTVAAFDSAKVYGQANPAFSVSYSGFVNGDDPGSLGGTLNLSTVATAANPIGAYAITPGGLTSRNYTITFASGTLTVASATLTVTADDATRVYGQSNPIFTDTLAGFVNGDNANVVTGGASLTTIATASSGVGAYAITAARGTLNAANYTFVFADGTLQVTPALLTVTADDATKVYGQANPVLTPTITGLVNGDDASVVNGSADLNTLATARSGAGTYPIYAAKGSLSAANYTFAFVNGTLAITPATLTVAANNHTRIYGQANGMLTDVITGFVNGDQGSIVLGSAKLGTPATVRSDVGPYPITAAQGTLNAANYRFVFVDGILTVTRATLTVSASNATKVYGQANPTLTDSVTGFVNGDNSTVVHGSATLTTSCTSGSGVGRYAILARQGSLNAANYTFRLVNGVLTVTPALITVTAEDASRVYGTPNPTFTARIMGFVNGDHATVVQGSPTLASTSTATSGVGRYSITAGPGSLRSANYTFAVMDGTLAVTPATLTVTANDQIRTYGDANPPFTDTVSGFVNGDTPTVVNGNADLSTTATATSGAGTYTITVGPGTLSAANYTFALVDGTLTIVPATPTTPPVEPPTSLPPTNTPTTSNPPPKPASTPTTLTTVVAAPAPASTPVLPTTSVSSVPLAVLATASAPGSAGSATSAASAAVATAVAHSNGSAEVANVATTGPAVPRTPDVEASTPRSAVVPTPAPPPPVTAQITTPPPPSRSTTPPSAATVASSPAPQSSLAPPVLQTEVLWSELDEFQPRVESTPVQAFVEAGVVTGVLASAGYLIVSARASYWLLTLLLARPLVWKRFDPMEVLFAWEKEKQRRRANGDADDNGETLQSLVVKR